MSEQGMIKWEPSIFVKGLGRINLTDEQVEKIVEYQSKPLVEEPEREKS